MVSEKGRQARCMEDLLSFKAANFPKHFSCIDYVHAIYEINNMPADLAVCMARLYWPEFKVVNGVVYIAELHFERYEQDLQNSAISSSGSQFWINLLEITGVFDNLSFDEAMEIAQAMANTWNAKLTAEFGPSAALARAISDDDTNEVFVTIGFPD